MEIQRGKRDTRSANSCSSNRCPNSSSNSSLNYNALPNQSQHPDLLDGGTLSHPEPSDKGHLSAQVQAQAPPGRLNRAWQIDA